MIAIRKIFPATFAALLLAAPAMAQDGDWRIVNASGFTLMELYVAPAGQAGLGADKLGAQVLPGGSDMTVAITQAGTCAYNLRMVFDDGSVREDDVDICAADSYTIE